MKRCLMVLLLLPAVHAAPVMFGPVPPDGGYTGRGSLTFYINITSPDLDTNNVRLFVISEDAYNNLEPWDNYTMSCTGSWRCSRTVSFSIAGSDTLEFFYFTSNDSSGNSSLGSPSSPLSFRIDRTAPQIIFNDPLNNSYVAGNQVINVTAVDAVSGVNYSTMRFSVDGSWMPMTEGMGYLNTLSYANNQSLVLKINVSDNMGNGGVSSINILVDNEAPFLSVINPMPGSMLKDSVVFSVAAGDALSGLNVSEVGFSVAGQNILMNCTPSYCVRDFNTTYYSDGNYNVTFFAYDIRGNVNTSAVPVSIKNSKPALSLAPKGYINSNRNAFATITNPGGIITAVFFSMLKGSDETNVAMACDGNFTFCTYPLDVASIGDGSVEVNATAFNTLNYTVFDSGTIIVDTIPPNLTASLPGVVKLSHTINAEITDMNNDRNGVIFSMLGASTPMTCIPQDMKMYCVLEYIFDMIQDGRYNVTLTATDFALNPATIEKEIIVDKNPPVLGIVTIEPLNPQVGIGVSVSAVISDRGSEVKSAMAVLRGGTRTVLNLSRNGLNWTGIFTTLTGGAYRVDIVAEDLNGNAANYTDVGYFFMGALTSCGNGVCDGGENYCLCPADCDPPACSAPILCSSGIPVCPGSSSCGDGVCSMLENCGTCPADCGFCPSGGIVNVPSGAARNESRKVEDVGGVVENIAQYAGTETPVFVTAVAVLILAGLVIVVWTKKRSSAVKTT